MMTLFLFISGGADKPNVGRLLESVHHASDANPAFRTFRRFLSQVSAEIGLVREVEVGSAKNAVRIAIHRFLTGSEESRHFGFFLRIDCRFVSVIHAIVHLREPILSSTCLSGASGTGV